MAAWQVPAGEREEMGDEQLLTAERMWRYALDEGRVNGKGDAWGGGGLGKGGYMGGGLRSATSKELFGEWYDKEGRRKEKRREGGREEDEGE